MLHELAHSVISDRFASWKFGLEAGHWSSFDIIERFFPVGNKNTNPLNKNASPKATKDVPSACISNSVPVILRHQKLRE